MTRVFLPSNRCLHLSRNNKKYDRKKDDHLALLKYNNISATVVTPSSYISAKLLKHETITSVEQARDQLTVRRKNAVVRSN